MFTKKLTFHDIFDFNKTGFQDIFPYKVTLSGNKYWFVNTAVVWLGPRAVLCGCILSAGIQPDFHWVFIVVLATVNPIIRPQAIAFLNTGGAQELSHSGPQTWLLVQLCRTNSAPFPIVVRGLHKPGRATETKCKHQPVSSSHCSPTVPPLPLRQPDGRQGRHLPPSTATLRLGDVYRTHDWNVANAKITSTVWLNFSCAVICSVPGSGVPVPISVTYPVKGGALDDST